MPLIKEQLLIPRYKVENLYPDCPYMIDDILTDDGNKAVRDQHGNPVPAVKFEHYPYLFRKLHWSEEREIQDMPEYVYCAARKSYFKVEKWNADSFVICGKTKKQYTNYTPATKEEYTAYINQKQQ